MEKQEEKYIEELTQLKESSNYRQLRCRDNFTINLASNDYLGLSSSSELREQFMREYSLNSYSFSAASSRLLTGNHSMYSRLEEQLSTLFRSEAALIFNSGYHAGIGILPALVGRGDLIVADKLVHASIIDGLRVSDATVWRYRHLDYSQIERYLEKSRDRYSRLIIVTESIFSMDGDVADLNRLADIKDRYEGLLYVDEAHSFGVNGEHGLGIIEEQNVVDRVELIVGTFGKAISSVGAYLICSGTIKEYLVNKMRSLIFTTGLPEINIAWTSFILEQESLLKERRAALSRNIDLISRGVDTKIESHIVPYIIGDNSAALEASNRFIEEGILVLPVRYPTVPKGSARLRLSLNSNIEPGDISRVIDILRDLKCR